MEGQPPPIPEKVKNQQPLEVLFEGPLFCVTSLYCGLLTSIQNSGPSQIPRKSIQPSTSTSGREAFVMSQRESTNTSSRW